MRIVSSTDGQWHVVSAGVAIAKSANRHVLERKFPSAYVEG